MIRVLIDGRVDGHDGIGRYTECLTRALRARAGSGVHIEVLPPTGTPRYSHAEGAELLQAARRCGAELIHTLDYRVPLEPTEIPLLVTIHDVLRLIRPQLCYSDEEFAARFGAARLDDLAAVTADLRGTFDPPPGVIRTPESYHEEFYARMLALAYAHAFAIVTPSRTVSRQLHTAIGDDSRIRISAWGADHLPSALHASTEAVSVNGPYLLYVGQARTHKGVDALLGAYQQSEAAEAGMRLVCAGRDFAAGTYGAELVTLHLGRYAVPVGPVSDTTLRVLYAYAEALVHLADHEGFGFTPLEALAAGSRVIASDIPVLRETLASHALFVDACDLDSVTCAIREVISVPDGPATRKRRQRWAQRYRWSRHADDVLALYNEVLR